MEKIESHQNLYYRLNFPMFYDDSFECDDAI